MKVVNGGRVCSCYSPAVRSCKFSPGHANLCFTAQILTAPPVMLLCMQCKRSQGTVMHTSIQVQMAMLRAVLHKGDSRKLRCGISSLLSEAC